MKLLCLILRRFTQIIFPFVSINRYSPVLISKMDHIQRCPECHFVGNTQWIKNSFLCPECGRSIKFKGGYYGS